MGLCTHLPDHVCTVGCWLEDVGGKTVAAVGGWGPRGGCTGVEGVCSPGDGGDVTGVAGWMASSTAGMETMAAQLRLTVPFCFDDVGKQAVWCWNNPRLIVSYPGSRLDCLAGVAETLLLHVIGWSWDALFLCWLPLSLWCLLQLNFKIVSYFTGEKRPVPWNLMIV